VDEAEVGDAEKGEVLVAVDRLVVVMYRLAARRIERSNISTKLVRTHYDSEPKVPLIESTISETLVARVAESCCEGEVTWMRTTRPTHSG
jgi:hypothetical protein